MLIEFLETGNGTVVVNSIQPQPVAGAKDSSAIGIVELFQLAWPRDDNGVPLPGIFSGEVLFQIFDKTTGNYFRSLQAFVLTRFGGVSLVADQTSIVADASSGTLAGSAVAVTLTASGDFSFKVIVPTANPCRESAMGIFLNG